MSEDRAAIKQELYEDTLDVIEGMIFEESDLIAVLSSVVAELHHHLPHFHWTGFYRVVSPGLLKVGPYQGGHGCLTIPFERGVCGKAAREGKTQLVTDVHALPYHIACSAKTRSEIVVPVILEGRVVAVLDVDSNDAHAFDEIDQIMLELLCGKIAAKFQ
jgi:L-methionine (R)-S-oxide reductase